jgi:K(+)-stimulated pyrophosphate-energized sodium pump
MRRDGGEGNTADIAAQIHDGAMVFMKREFRVLITVHPVGRERRCGSRTETRRWRFSSVPCARGGRVHRHVHRHQGQRAHRHRGRDEGAAAALMTAFSGGSIMGLTVASMGLLGIGGLFLFFGEPSGTCTSSTALRWVPR